MKLLFYGRLAEAIAAELQMDAPPGCSIAQLRDRLADAYPEAAQTLQNRRARTVVGNALVHDDYVLRGAETVEFMPPVSGG